MLTLKLYRNGPLAPGGRTVILETVGLWVDQCENEMKHIRAYKKKVGVMDEDGTPEFYVGGTPPSAPSDIDYYDWGVLENAQGKTTEMFR